MDNGVNSFTRSYMRSAVGTRFYLSPEIYQSLVDDQPCRHTQSVDIFSMGLLLWAMFDGLSIPGSCQEDRYLTPFADTETDPMPVAQAITQGNIEIHVMEREENIRCKNIVQRMLSKDPKARPTAEEVLQTLLGGYGDYRLSQGVVRVVAIVDDENIHPGYSTCPCTETNPSCPPCSCSVKCQNSDCFRFWKGPNDDVDPTGCWSCSCTGANPSCPPCSCSVMCQNSDCFKFWKGPNDDVHPAGCWSCSCTKTDHNCSSPCSCTGVKPTCTPYLRMCIIVLRCIGCVLCYVDKNEKCAKFWKGKGILFILLSILISIIMILIMIPYVFLIFTSCFIIFFLCVTNIDAFCSCLPCLWWFDRETPAPSDLYNRCPNHCPCLSPQSGCCEYSIEDVTECCSSLQGVIVSNHVEPHIEPQIELPVEPQIELPVEPQTRHVEPQVDHEDEELFIGYTLKRPDDGVC